MRNAHFISKDFSFFIDGLPPDHKCDSLEREFVSRSGKVIVWHTYRQWAHLTWEAREKLIHEYHLKIDDPILSGSVACSICKQSALSQAMWL